MCSLVFSRTCFRTEDDHGSSGICAAQVDELIKLLPEKRQKELSGPNKTNPKKTV